MGIDHEDSDTPLTGEIIYKPLPGDESTPDAPASADTTASAASGTPPRKVVFYTVRDGAEERQVDDRPRRQTGAALTGVLMAQVAGCAAGILGAATAFWQRYGFDNLGAVAAVGVLCAVIVGTHAAVVVWTLRARPGPTPATIAQTPYVAAYVLLLAWWQMWVPLDVVAWATAASAGFAWSVVWYIRHPRTRRRTQALAAILGVLVAANGAGVAVRVWRSSGGLGLIGAPTPWVAFSALTASSCLSDLDFYWRNGEIARADCPSGPTADFWAGDYDESGFNEVLCSEQPRAAFSRWWVLNKQRQLTFRFEFRQGDAIVDGVRVGPPFPDSGDDEPEAVKGTTATMVMTAVLENISAEDLTADPGVRPDKKEETWNVRLESTSLGGWKVCGIDIANPIKLRDV